MLVGRVVQGAAGGIFPLAFGIIRDEFPRERVAGGIGLMSALLGVGGGAGVVLAGPIVDHLSLPLAVLAAAGPARRRPRSRSHLFVPESPVRVPGRVNWAGAALMSVGLAAVLLAVSETATWHWLSAKTLGVLAVGVVAARRSGCGARRASDHPLVDMRMMRIRGVWTTNAVALLLGFGMYASFILLPEFVETPTRAGYGFGASVTEAGLFLVPSTIAMLIVGAQTGRLEKRFGSKPPLLAGAAARRRVRSCCSRVARGRALGDLPRGGCCSARGIGLAFAAMVNLIIENVGPAETGIATGMNTVTRTVGGAFGGAAVASILAAHRRRDGHPDARTASRSRSRCARSRSRSASSSASRSRSAARRTRSRRTRRAISSS